MGRSYGPYVVASHIYLYFRSPFCSLTSSNLLTVGRMAPLSESNDPQFLIKTISSSQLYPAFSVFFFLSDWLPLTWLDLTRGGLKERDWSERRQTESSCSIRPRCGVDVPRRLWTSTVNPATVVAPPAGVYTVRSTAGGRAVGVSGLPYKPRHANQAFSLSLIIFAMLSDVKHH